MISIVYDRAEFHGDSQLIEWELSKTDMTHINNQHCVICGAVLTVHQAARGGTCDEPSCKHQKLLTVLAQQRMEEAELMSQVRVAAEKMLDEQRYSNEAEMQLVVVPANERLVSRLEETRKRAFVRHLNRILDELEANGWEQHGQGAVGQELESESTDADIARGCATCRGYCCSYGGTHAFLKVETIRAYLQQHPGLSRAQVMAAYLERIGEQTYQGSCVFHSVTGCCLPRQMRSKTCNHYLCKGLRDFQAQRGKEDKRVIVIAAVEDKAVHRMILSPITAR